MGRCLLPVRVQVLLQCGLVGELRTGDLVGRGPVVMGVGWFAWAGLRFLCANAVLVDASNPGTERPSVPAPQILSHGDRLRGPCCLRLLPQRL